MLSAVSVAVYAFADAAIFELALAHLAQQMVYMPHHVEGLKMRAINKLLAGAADAVTLHSHRCKVKIETGFGAPPTRSPVKSWKKF